MAAACLATCSPSIATAPYGKTQQPGKLQRRRLVAPAGRRHLITCAAGVQRENIKVVVAGAAGRLGCEAIRAISAARGMEVVGAVDHKRTGEDAGEVAGLQEGLEIPILEDLVLVLSSVAQARSSSAVLVDFTEPSAVYDNVRQAVAFGISAVVGTRPLSEDAVRQLADFCDKSSMGCVVAPNLCIGAVLQAQAAQAAAFHYGSVEILEQRDPLQGPAEAAPSQAAQLTADGLSDLGRTFNQCASQDSQARGVAWGANVRIHSLELPGVLAGQEVRFGAAGESYSISHQVYHPQAYMPGLLLAIRRVVRLKSLVYGLEKIL